MRPRLVLPLAVLASVMVVLGLSAVVEFPGERPFKEWLGFDYGQAPCKRIAGDGPSGRWRPETPLPSLRDEARAARLGGGAFIAGGIDTDHPVAPRSTSRVERYDFVSRSYTRLPPLPMPLNHIGIAAVRRDLYVIGGFGENRNGIVSTNRAFRFRERDRRWEELPPMRYARGGHGLAVVGERIYAIGGKNISVSPGSSPEVAPVESLDTRSLRWSTHASLPQARDHLGVAVYEGQIYALGGRLADSTTLARFDRYDPRTDRWVTLSDAPTPMSGMVLAGARGLLVAAGGEEPNNGHILGSVWAFEPESGRWLTLPRLPAPVHGYAGVYDGGRVYVFGGSTCPGFQPTTKSYSLAVPQP